MKKTYAQIQNSITSSKKIKALASYEARWAYMCAHTSDLGNYAGLFVYPITIWAHDMQKPIESMNIYIKDLINVGLIEYDFDEETVRIVAWFDKKNAPDSANRMIGLMTDYRSLDLNNSEILCRSIAEFFGVITKAQIKNWKASEIEKLQTAIVSFWSDMAEEHGDIFAEIVRNFVEQSPQNKGKVVLSYVESQMNLSQSSTLDPDIPF